jgi:ketosteroid isomerase-like protein
MTADSSKATAEAQIRALVDDEAKAIRAKDVDGRVSSYALDVLLFRRGRSTAIPRIERAQKVPAGVVRFVPRPIGYELRDLTAGADVGFSHSVNRVSATTMEGQRLDMWWRATVCYRRIDGAWMVTHQHASVPFDAESGKASLGLKP